MINIKINNKLIKEKMYIIDVLFSEFLGLLFKVEIYNEIEGIHIILPNSSLIKLDDTFWTRGEHGYINVNMLPNVRRIENPFFQTGNILLLYGKDHFVVEEKKIECGVDILGCCFFMLSRMEEAIVDDRDTHERFSALSSVAYKYKFLDRPIVDEYTELLWQMIFELDPSIERKVRKPNMHVTCDVDWPFDPIRRSLLMTFRKSIRDIIINKDFSSALENYKHWAIHALRLKQVDSYRDSINWMMDINEKFGRKISFYFITECTSKIDSDFDFDSHEIRELFRQIHARGHYIGLHPGYRCFDNPELFNKSAKTLKRILKEENIVQSEIGGRMHLLRWDIELTPQLWESNGFDYDSTLSFADSAGFRCGTCHEYSMFDLVRRAKMKLKQRPLITMECTIIAKRYENLGYTNKAMQRFLYFKNICNKFNGSYTLLWHNSHFNNISDRKFYKKLIS